MIILVLGFVILFALLTMLGLRFLLDRSGAKRLAFVLDRGHDSANRKKTFGWEKMVSSVSTAIQNIDHLVPRDEEETSNTRRRLARAGLRSDAHVRIYFSAKALVPLTLSIVAAFFGPYDDNTLLVYVGVLGIGYLVPDYWLTSRIKERQRQIVSGLPDALDVMVICIEAGLSMDQATLRTSKELVYAQPAISDELSLVHLEQRAGSGRVAAWKKFAARMEVDSVGSLVALIVQADQFGTSMAKALRVHADTLRTQRRQSAEEQAAKTAVKLVFPLVFFIFPSIFVVVLGPAMIILLDSFQLYF